MRGDTRASRVGMAPLLLMLLVILLVSPSLSLLLLSPCNVKQRLSVRSQRLASPTACPPAPTLASRLLRPRQGTRVLGLREEDAASVPSIDLEQERDEEEEEEEEEEERIGFRATSLAIVDGLISKLGGIGLREEFKVLLLSTLIGLSTGGAVTLFKTGIEAVKGASYGPFVVLFPQSLGPWALGVVPVLGAVVVVLLRASVGGDFGPGLAGSVKEVDRQVPVKVLPALAKSAAAVTTLGTGNSLGPEGPAVELGVAFTRILSGALFRPLSVERQRTLIAAGAAAGVAAGFNAPIAGIFFSLEVVRESFSKTSGIGNKSGIAATLLCATVSSLVARIGLNEEYALRPAPYLLESPLAELPLYLGLGLLSGLVALMFQWFVKKTGEAFEGECFGFKWMRKVPTFFKPLIGSAIMGLAACKFPQILFFGYDTLDKLLGNTSGYATIQLVTLCVVKALATAVCVSSGLVGGTFAPSLFLGATAGAAYQKVAASVLSHPLPFFGALFGDAGVFAIAQEPAYAMVGAASVLSALFKAPLTGSLLLFELTQDYDIILPLLSSAGLGALVVELAQRRRQQSEDRKAAAAAAAKGGATSLDSAETTSLAVANKKEGASVASALLPLVVSTSARTPVSLLLKEFARTRTELALVVEDSQALPTPKDASDASDKPAAVYVWTADELLKSEGGLRISGVVTLRDITATMARRADAQLQQPGKKDKPLRVKSVVNRAFYSIPDEADLTELSDEFSKRAVRYLPVMRAVGGGGEGGGVVCVGVSGLNQLRIGVRLKETYDFCAPGGGGEIAHR